MALAHKLTGVIIILVESEISMHPSTKIQVLRQELKYKTFKRSSSR